MLRSVGVVRLWQTTCTSIELNVLAHKESLLVTQSYITTERIADSCQKAYITQDVGKIMDETRSHLHQRIQLSIALPWIRQWSFTCFKLAIGCSLESGRASN